MTQCPLCEQPVAPGASECGFCGRNLRGRPHPGCPGWPAARLRWRPHGLRSIAVTEELTPGLEYSSQAAAGEVALELVPGVERSTIDSVGEVAVDETPDVERTPLAVKEWTPESEGPLVCLVCGTPAPPEGVICDGCGYRLPVRTIQEGTLLLLELSDIAAPSDDDVVKCPDCGCKTPPGRLCQACGVLMRPTSA